MKNHKGQHYEIEFIDELNNIYREKVLMQTELQELALRSHLLRGNIPESFWSDWYNYRSSIASILRMKARIDCGVGGSDVTSDDITPEQEEKIQLIEHKGWNAYMRSIGYVRGSKTNHLAKTHECLVPFQELAEEYKQKDLLTIAEIRKSDTLKR